MGRKIASALYWGYLATALSVFWFAVVTPWLLITPFDRRRRFSHWYAYTWANHLHWVSPFWTMVVQHPERMHDDETYVLVANHQSAGDILGLFALRKQFRWVSKRELFRVPFLGWMMAMAGYVSIKRGDSKSRKQMMDSCMRQLEMGNTVAIFPEGTRSKDGQMRPFKRGAFHLACESKKKVLPVLFEGVGEVLPNRGFVFPMEEHAYPRVRVMEAVDPADFEYDAKRLTKHVRQLMLEEQVRLRAEIDEMGGLTVRPPGRLG